MSLKTRLQQKKGKSAPDNMTTTLSTDYENETQTKTTELSEAEEANQPTIQDVFKKLAALDRIENKLDNLSNRVESLEERMAKVEDNQDDYQEVNKDITGLKNLAQTLQRSVENLENKDRLLNIKVINLPVNPFETTVQLQNKVIEILQHVNPTITSQNVTEVWRLPARGRFQQQVGQLAQQSQQIQQSSRSSYGAENTPQRSPPVIAKLSSATLTQNILKIGNKKMKSFKDPNVRLVDDVSKSLQDRRSKLIPKMKELRNAGLFAFIPFGTTAKIVYKEGEEWKTIWPDQ